MDEEEPKKGEKKFFDRIKKGLSRIGTLNIVLVIVGAFFLWFNWQMLQLAWSDKGVPETYACSVIAATIGECGICGWIRTTKDKYNTGKAPPNEEETESNEQPDGQSSEPNEPESYG